MTEKIMRGKKGFSATVMVMVAACSFLVLLKNPDIAIGCMREGLRICGRIVVPSLFPFMVLSGLFVELGCSDIFARFLGRPMRFLFGISGSGSSAPLMGALCGFPVGASTAHKLYENGRISRGEMTRLLAFSNNPSSAFLVSSVGSALWSCPRFGIVLYVIQLISSIIIGVVLRYVYPLREKTEYRVSEHYSVPGVRIFPRVVSEAALSMLNVCALVLFFASIVGALVSILEGFGIGQTSKALIYGFFEMSGAVAEAAEVFPRETGLVITALICGWSGLSVHFQVISICYSDGVSFAPYFAAKAAQGVISALLMLIYIRVVDPSLPAACVPALAASETVSVGSTALAVAANAVLGISLIIHFILRFSRRSSSHGIGRAK